MKPTILSALFILFSLPGVAEIYQWTDATGQVHFGDRPPPDSSSKEVAVQVNTYTSITYDLSVFDTGNTLVMYTTDRCGYCRQARAYFHAHNIPYQERNIDSSRSARLQHKNMKATGVPVILLGKHRMNGFQEAQFRRFYQQYAQN